MKSRRSFLSLIGLGAATPFVGLPKIVEALPAKPAPTAIVALPEVTCTSAVLTPGNWDISAVWRQTLDAGMFERFPGTILRRE